MGGRVGRYLRAGFSLELSRDGGGGRGREGDGTRLHTTACNSVGKETAVKNEIDVYHRGT